MKILVVCQYYYPEQFRITDICEELVKRGHDVSVITGLPNYPMGRIYDGYTGRQHRDETVNGVKIHRCFTIGRAGGTLKRFLNYYSFSLSSALYAGHIKEKYDAVFVNQLSPVMMARAGIAYKRKHSVKLLLYCLDLWPESLVAGGVSRDSAIYRVYRRVSGKIYGSCDDILITSKMFDSYFEKEFGISGTRYLPQYAEDMFTPQSCRKIPDNGVDLMFAGNIGAVQSVDTVIRAAALTKNNGNLRWHIVGDGSEFESVKKLASKLGAENVIFHGRHAAAQMPEFYSMADAMVVTMNDNPVLSMTLPGKVQTYMAAGKPIIAAADGETGRVIAASGCGLCSKAQSAELLADNALKFARSRDKWNEFSAKAREYYLSEFSKEKFIKDLESCLRDAVSEQ